jgi:hypothetical protein
MELNGIHQLLVYSDNVNRLDENINIWKDTEGLLEASRKVGIEINTEKSKYMVMSCHQNADKIIIC